MHQGMAAELFRFNVFPPRLVTPVLSDCPITPGTTVGVQYHVVPSWLSLFFASRVARTVDGPDVDGWRTGFYYQTLPGHPEHGEELFCVTKRPDGTVWVSLSSWSVPGLPLTRWVAPLLRMLQVRANSAALDHLEATARRYE